MLRSSLLRASLVLALTSCSYVQRINPWHHAPPAAGDDGRLAELDSRGANLDRDRAQLEQKRDKLRAARDKGKDYGIDEAQALSATEQQLDAVATGAHRGTSERATLAELPRAAWWYLFVPPSQWSRGPLAIDRERAPGYYAAMMCAVEHLLQHAQRNAPLTVDEYAELARIAMHGVYEREHERPMAKGFAHEPTRYPIAAIHDLASLHVQHLGQALAELKDEGVAGWNSEYQRERSNDIPPPWLAKLLREHEDVNPHNKPARLVYQRAHGAHGGPGFTEWLVAWNHYDAHEARKWAAEWLADYAAEQAKGAHDAATSLRSIARLVRRMEVSHVLASRADAVNAMLLLQYLLAASGQAPSIVEDPSVFGGREPLDELVAEIQKGQARYQALVKELSARTAPLPPTAAPGAIGAPQERYEEDAAPATPVSAPAMMSHAQPMLAQPMARPMAQPVQQEPSSAASPSDE